MVRPGIREETMGNNRGWGAVVTGALLLLFGLAAMVSPAMAATTSVAVSADPTEEKTVTLTITGETEANRDLWVAITPGATSGCQQANANELYTGDSQVRLAGEALPTGNYQRTVQYVPENPGPYLVCSFVTESSVSAPSARGSATFQVRKPNVTSTIGVSADPTEDRAVTLTVTGQTEVDRHLWVAITPGATSGCQQTNANALYTGNSQVRMAAEPLPAGNYSRTVSYTPPDAGPYLACAFVTEDYVSTPNVRAKRTFQVREPNVSSTVSLSADPREGMPVAVTVTGQAELDRELWVVVVPAAGSECPGETPSKLFNVPGDIRILLEGSPVGPGGFRRDLSFTPPNSGSFFVCSYISEGPATKADSRVTKILDARKGRVQMSVKPEGTFRHLSKSWFSISGTTEVAGELSVYYYFVWEECPTVPGEGFSEFSDILPVEPGQFDSDWWIVPTYVAVHRICAYLTDESGQTVGSASVDVPVERNPAFLPKLITPNDKWWRGRPAILRWKVGPRSNSQDYLQIFHARPKASRLRGGVRLTTRMVRFGGGRASGVKSARVQGLPYGRYWWRIVRQHRASNYWEPSRPRSFMILP